MPPTVKSKFLCFVDLYVVKCLAAIIVFDSHSLDAYTDPGYAAIIFTIFTVIIKNKQTKKTKIVSISIY